MDETTGRAVLALLEPLFDGMLTQQRAKVLRLAREVVPNIGPEDLRNAHDFPELRSHPTFEWEDGLLAGLVAAQVAVRSEVRRQFMPPEPPPG